MSAPTCAKCHDPLTHTLDPDSDTEDHQSSPTTVPDDVELPCHDHFHWECLLDSYELSRCPACNAEITSHPASGSSSNADAQPRILVNMNNEGGLQQNIDIFPILQEESYLRAYPEERKSRAFLEFCREGDHKAIVDLLNSGDDDDDSDSDEEMDDGENDNPLSGPSKSPAKFCATRTRSVACSPVCTPRRPMDTARLRGCFCCWRASCRRWSSRLWSSRRLPRWGL